MRLPPPAMRWPASSGISATSLCIRSRMTALTWLRSAATSWIIGSSEGARAAPIGWTVALIWRRCAPGRRQRQEPGLRRAGRRGTREDEGGPRPRRLWRLRRPRRAGCSPRRLRGDHRRASAAKAQAFCARIRSSRLRPLALARADGLGAERPWLVVDAAGPFQEIDYRLPEACIAAGGHYLDLADGRDFVCGIGALDDAARAAGVVVISGASSLPALSAAVCDRLAAGLDRVSAIDAALSAGNRVAGGVSVTRAMLSYAGKPVRCGAARPGGRASAGRRSAGSSFAFPARRPLRRRVAICDVPDLALLPDRYPGRPAARFRAGNRAGVAEYRPVAAELAGALALAGEPAAADLAAGLGPARARLDRRRALGDAGGGEGMARRDRGPPRLDDPCRARRRALDPGARRAAARGEARHLPPGARSASGAASRSRNSSGRSRLSPSPPRSRTRRCRRSMRG